MAVSTVHARIQKVLSEGVQLCNSGNVFFKIIFQLIKERKIQMPLKTGHHGHAYENKS